EVSEGDLPGAAVVAVSLAADSLDYDRLRTVHGSAPLDRRFQLGKAWPLLRQQCLAAKLHRQCRWQALGTDVQAHFYRFVVIGLFVGVMLDRGAERSNETVGREDTQESR